MYQNTQKHRDALNDMHEELKSWGAVADLLNDCLAEPLSQTTYNLVAKGERNNKHITAALVELKMVEPPRERIKRCWTGNREEAGVVDKWLRDKGYKNLNEYVDIQMLGVAVG